MTDTKKNALQRKVALLDSLGDFFPLTLVNYVVSITSAKWLEISIINEQNRGDMD